MTTSPGLTEDQKNAVFDVLVTMASACGDDRPVFLAQWPACREWRFGGAFGSGGKVHYRSSGEVTVSAYSEHMTPDLRRQQRQVNERLARVASGCGDG